MKKNINNNILKKKMFKLFVKMEFDLLQHIFT